MPQVPGSRRWTMPGAQPSRPGSSTRHVLQLAQFSRAIEAAQRLGQEPPGELYRARGQMYELLGEFDAARDDYTQAQVAARATGDRTGGMAEPA